MKLKALSPLCFALCLAACGSTTSGGGGTGDPNQTAGTGKCGTNATTITYEGQTKPVLVSTCVSCHAAGGSRAQSPLDTQANAKTYLTAANVKTWVDSGAMPSEGAALTANQTCIIDEWVKDGYQ